MNNTLEMLQQRLTSGGYSSTRVRGLVFAALEHAQPQTMRELVIKLSPAVDRASIYRTVALFEQLGIVQRIQIGWKYKLELSNEFQDHHHHLTCVQCGKFESFHEHESLEGLLQAIAEGHRFELKSHQLELQGVCSDCSSKE